MLESPDGVDESMIKESLEIDMSFLLSTLKDRERDVLKMFFGIDRPYPLTLDDIAEEIGLLGVKAIQEAGKRLGCVIEMDGEYRIGNDWADCH